jgi:hypothetical protein
MWPHGFGQEWRFTESGWFGNEIRPIDVTWYFQNQEDEILFRLIWDTKI